MTRTTIGGGQITDGTITNSDINHDDTYEVGGIKIKPQTPPSNPSLSGEWVFYTDSADSNKIKIKKSDGTILDLTLLPTKVSTTGSPTTGSLAGFAGSLIIQTVNLTGDVTTSNALATAISNNAVTNAKLNTMAANTVKANATTSTANPTDVALSASQLFGRGSTGNIAPIDIGAGLVMTGATLSRNGWVPIQTLTASNSPNLDFTGFSSNYGGYIFVFSNLIPATNNATINMRTSTDGGSTWVGSLSMSKNSMAAGGKMSEAVGAATTTGQVLGGLGTTVGLDGYLQHMCGFGGTGSALWITGSLTNHSSNATCCFVHISNINSSVPINGVRFIPSSGNITSGTVTVFALLR